MSPLISTTLTEELNRFRLYTVIAGLLILTISAGGALSLTWMRQQITYSAQSSAHLQKTLQGVEQENVRLAAHIAKAHRSEHLLAKASPDLNPRSTGQVVWMPAIGRFSKTFIAQTQQRHPNAVSESPLSISFDLALLNAN